MHPTRRVRAIILAAIAIVVCAAPARASVRAAGAPRCSPNGDWPPTVQATAVQSALAVEPGNTLRRIVTVDFDRDGDLDVLASTDRGVRVWLNDGQGNLIVQPPHAAPAVVNFNGMARIPASREESSESIQNDLPSFRFFQTYSHAPPESGRGIPLVCSSTALHDASTPSLVPRAPPA
jgi:hypothetical protein